MTYTKNKDIAEEYLLSNGSTLLNHLDNLPEKVAVTGRPAALEKKCLIYVFSNINDNIAGRVTTLYVSEEGPSYIGSCTKEYEIDIEKPIYSVPQVLVDIVNNNNNNNNNDKTKLDLRKRCDDIIKEYFG